MQARPLGKRLGLFFVVELLFKTNRHSRAGGSPSPEVCDYGLPCLRESQQCLPHKANVSKHAAHKSSRSM
jgi:hypothetical protein